MRTAENVCVLCGKTNDDGETVCLREKGAVGVNNVAKERGVSIRVSAGCVVHTSLRVFINKNYLSSNASVGAESSMNRRQRRTPKEGDLCIFCDKPIDIKHGQEGYCVRTDGLRTELLRVCDERRDAWAETMRGKLNFLQDLHASDAVYHQQCCVNFRTGRQPPVRSTKRKRSASGRPTDPVREAAFSEVCAHLEMNLDAQLTLPDLVQKQMEYLEGAEPYSVTHMKAMLIERYGTDISFSSVPGKPSIVTMHKSVSKILRRNYELFSDAACDEETRKNSIMESAARIIRSDILSMESDLSAYPPAADIYENSVSFLPSSLRLFLEKLLAGEDESRMAGIGQAIVQGARPRSIIAPLQLGLAIQVHHHFRSRFLVDTLYKLTFCSSYSEVTRFESNAACTRSDNMIGSIDGGVCVFAGDNVDHNVATLNGEGSFHGMGMIAAVTPANSKSYTVSRSALKDFDVSSRAKVDITNFGVSNAIKPRICFATLQIPVICPHVDILWQVSTRFENHIPSWSGTMHLVHSAEPYPGQSSVYFLPMIDLKPGDPTCIMSTLNFLHRLAQSYGLDMIVTFDQPFFWRTCELVEKLPDGHPMKASAMILLGTFHTLMNLEKRIRSLMSDTGIKSPLECIYGPNTISHMMQGKMCSTHSEATCYWTTVYRIR